MTYVIADPCIGTTDQSCIEVCPVSCIYQVGQNPDAPDEPYMLVIDSQECIDCAACVPECPVEAIEYEESVPEKWHAYIEINAMHDGRGSGNGPDEEGRLAKSDIADAAKEVHLRNGKGNLAESN